MLTPEEIAFFEENGYVGPFDLSAPELVAAARRAVDEELLVRESPIYGGRSGRDWHLASRPVYDLCSHEAIVERVAGVLGPDILLWRSQMFYKKPGDGVTAWHQDYNFPGPFKVPAIDPAITVTAWIALDAATVENGCVELVAGSHKDGRLETVKSDEGEGIFGRNYRLEREVSEDDVVAKMTLEPGQFVLFSNLTVHGSGPNESDMTRLGIGVRFTSADVRVYPGQEIDGQGMSLENFGCVLVRGEDRFRHNRMRTPPVEGADLSAAVDSPTQTAFKAGYRLGYMKGGRHAARGIRVAIEERTSLLKGALEAAKGYGGSAAHPDELKAGLAAGYADGIEGRPFDTRYGSPIDGGRKLPGPLRKLLRSTLRRLKRR
jgi:non-heme Fe2+,alpha-ketoglutarate-dependent halogenase